MSSIVTVRTQPSIRAAIPLILLFGMVAILGAGCHNDPPALSSFDSGGGIDDATGSADIGMSDTTPGCSSTNTLCSGVCVNTQTDNQNCGTCGTTCKPWEVCNKGKCAAACGTDETDCNDICVNIKKDPNNCGACGKKCDDNQVCVAGKCVANCASGTTQCSKLCVNTQTDNQNCGACGKACKPGEACVAGKCTMVCPPGFTNCSGTCVKLTTDNSNCGKCGNTCKSGYLCKNGTCTFACPPGLNNCSGLCYNLLTDPNNCGVCGKTCAVGETCVAGKCASGCPSGYTACTAGKCTHTAADNNNCGKCGNACKTGYICVAGACILNCPAGQKDCSGVCKNTKADPNNCGTCGMACGFGQVCQSGKCVVTCVAGHTNCTGSCANLQQDPQNCGSCGNVCKTGQETCKAGKCVPIQCDVFTYGLSARPVDITFIIDQSGSMSGEIASVKTNINKFSTYIATTDIDYHVIMLAKSGSGTYDICVTPPLGGTACGASNTRFLQVNQAIASTNELTKFQSNISSIEAFCRKDSLRHIVVITDDNSSYGAQPFNTWAKARAGWKDYVFHSVVSTAYKSGCTATVGSTYTQLSSWTGGIVIDLCGANWTNLFNALGKAVTGLAIKQYKPTKAPDLTSMEVYYNNTLKTSGTDWSWDSSNGYITLKGTMPSIGSKIMVCYLVKK